MSRSLPLPVAQRALLVAIALALLALLTLLAALTSLPLLALLTLLAALASLSRAGPCSLWLALLAEGVVEQLLLAADDVAELVHHLAEALVLALIGHAAGLQPVEQVAQLAQHLLGHVAIAGARHVLEIAAASARDLAGSGTGCCGRCPASAAGSAPALDSCSRNCASACLSSCISFWISSSEAPCSSAFAERSWAARRLRSASVRLPSSMRSAMFHSWRDHAVASGARAHRAAGANRPSAAPGTPAGPR